jgi:hypothetical protein
MEDQFGELGNLVGIASGKRPEMQLVSVH